MSDDTEDEMTLIPVYEVRVECESESEAESRAEEHGRADGSTYIRRTDEGLADDPTPPAVQKLADLAAMDDDAEVQLVGGLR